MDYIQSIKLINKCCIFNVLHFIYKLNMELILKSSRIMMYSDAELVEASKHGNTPLIIATLHCDVPSIKLLIDAGADINKANNNGYTPSYFAASIGYQECVELFIDAGADINKANNSGYTPLFIAILSGHDKCAKLLLDAGADINKANNDGETPLYISALYGDVVFVNLLLDAIYKDIADKVLLAVSKQDIIFDTAFIIFKKTVEVYIPVTQRMLISLKILNEPNNHKKLYDIFQEKFSNKNKH